MQNIEIMKAALFGQMNGANLDLKITDPKLLIKSLILWTLYSI
jgi:hypothetical protein